MLRRFNWTAPALLAVALGFPQLAAAQGGPYVNFETIPTRALALSADGTRLFVTNTPDGRLEIFNVTPTGLQPAGSVTVGLDPVAVAARPNGEVWVVNHLSDSVSVVNTAVTPARVVRTLNVGDEPRDIVFAGPGGNRAFITAARRGQNHPGNTVNLTQVPSQPRADVWVFDASNPGAQLGGRPLTIVPLFADKPGAMTVSNDGRTVFVSIFTSGNLTTTINDSAVCGRDDQAGLNQFSAQGDGPCRLEAGGTGPGGVPAPNVNQADRAPNARTGIIVKFDPASGAWRDQARRDWRDAVPFSLPDNDVFAIDAAANPPRQSNVFRTVGTLNKSLAVNPATGQVFVATIEAININRFLSVPGMNLFPNPQGVGGAARTADPVTGRTLNGHLYESRIAILGANGSSVSRHLNKHINYEVVPSPAGVKERSVADPQGLVFSNDGSTLFVAALGSNKIVPFNTAALVNDTFQPNAGSHISLTGLGGPTDMVLTADGARMFVYKRFDNAVATVDIAARRETASLPLFSPEPAAVRNGRPFFYDSLRTSSNGEANCNVCHPGADKDDLAWDLGSPFSGLAANPNDFVPAPGILRLLFPDPVAFNRVAVGIIDNGSDPTVEFNPLKGPMTVLTLRGISNSGPMFWRGDATNTRDSMDERANFQNFNIVFPALLGREATLPAADFTSFTNWALSIVPPPNPHRALNNVLNASQASGQNIFTGGEGATDVVFSCQDCHGLNPGRGQFGTRGEDVIEGETQFFKVTQLRTTYDKVGMFGQTTGRNPATTPLGGPRGRGIGPQIRGTGALHDGSAASPEEFLTADVFQLDARQLRQVVDFVFAFPNNLASVVGQQVTLRSDSGADVNARVDLLLQRARATFVLPGPVNSRECDLVAKAVFQGQTRGFLFRPVQNNFLSDRNVTATIAQLRGIAATAGQEVTFTCVYPGGGRRFGIDRNNDGRLDGQ